MLKAIETKNAPGAVGPYSQAISAAGMIFSSGNLPIDPATGEIPATVEEQTKQSLENLKAVIEAGGATLADVVKTTVFIKDMNDFAKVNAVYAEYFKSPFPGRSCVEVARLPKDVLVEIEGIAVK